MNYWEEVLKVVCQWEHLGIKTTELTKSTLIGHVPHVAPEAWLHSYYPGLNDLEIRDLEHQLGAIFPRSFYEFLTCSNGIKIFSDTLRIFGKRKFSGRTLETVRQPYDLIVQNYPTEKPKDSPESLVIIGSYGMDGSRLYFLSGEEPIYFSPRGSARPLKSWNNFWTMLTEEAARLVKLFDSQGKKYDSKFPTVPVLDE